MDHWNTRKRVHDEDDDNEDRSECWKRSRLQSADSPASGSPATASPRNWSTLSFLNTGAASWMNTDIIGEVKNQIAQDKDSNNVTRSPSHSSTSSAASSFGISDLKRLGMSSFLSNINVNKHSPNHPSTSSATLGISEFNKKGTSSFLNTSFVPWSQSDICQQLKQSCSSNLFSCEQVNKSPQAVDSDDMDICSSVSDSPTPTRPPLPEESPPAPPTPPPPAPPPLSPLPPPPSLSAFPALNSVSKNYFDSSPKLASNSTLLPPPLLPRLLAELAHSDISLSPPSHLPHVAEHDNKSPPQSPPQPAEHSVDSDSVLTPPLCSSHQSGEVDHDSALSAAVLHQSAPMSHHHIEEHDKELSPSPTFSHTEDDMKHKMLPTVFPQSEEYDSNSIPSSSSPIDEQFPELTTENDTVFSPEPTLCHELVADDKNFEPVTLPSDSEDSSPLPISTTPIPQQLPNISEDSNSLTIIATYIPQQLPKFSEDSNSLITTASPMPQQLPKFSEDSNSLITTASPMPQQLPKLSEDSSSLTITTPPDQLPELEEANYPLTVTFLPLTHPSPTISEDKSPLTSDQLSQIAAENSPLTSSPVTDPSPKISVEDEIDSKLTHESPGSNVLEENAMPPSTSPPEPTVEGETYLSKEDGDFQDESPPKLSASPDKIISERFASTSDKDEIKQVPLLQENIDSDVQSIKNIDETKNPDEDNKEEETENERSSSALKTIERINELQVMPSHSYKEGCNFMKAFPPRPVDAERLISNIPSYWITAKDPGTFLSSYLTVGIPTCSEEYQYVLNKFIGVLPCSILAIDRVENPYTLFNYELRKEELLKYGVDFMEFHLFHGTSIENLVSIMETNFDWTRYGTNVGSKFGQGVSFTPNASYAVHYTDKSLELNVIILTRVIVSKFCLGDTSNILPPVGYDTTISPTGKVWVKYNNDEFYPDYLVYFKLNDMTWFEKAEQPMHPSEAIKFFNHQAETLYMAPRFPGPSHPDESHPQEDFTSDNFVYTPEHNRRKTPENPPELDARSSQQKTSVRGSKARRCSRRPVRTRARKRDLPWYSVESPESHQRSPEFIPGNNPMRLSPPMPLMANNPFISNQHVNVPSISPPNQFHFNHPGIGRHPDEPFIFRGNQGPHLSPPDPFNRPEMIRHPDEPFMFRGNQGPHLSPPDPFNRPEMIRHANEPFIFRGNQGPGIPHLSPPHPFNRSEMVRHVDEPFNFRGNQGPGIPHLSPPDPFNRSEMIRHVDEPFNFRGNQGPGIPHLSPPDHPGFSGGIQRHPNDPFVFHGTNQGPEMPHRFSPPDQFQFNRPGDGRLLPHHENQSFNFPGNNF